METIATVTHITGNTRRLVTSADGRHWVISQAGGIAQVFPADVRGQVTDWGEVAGGATLDEAQADLEDRLAGGLVVEPFTGRVEGGLATDGAVLALRDRLTLPARRGLV